MANGPLRQEQPVALSKAILYRPDVEGKKIGLLVFPQPSPGKDRRVSEERGTRVWVPLSSVPGGTMAIFRLIQYTVMAPKNAVQAVLSIGQRILGWWIGRRRGWTPDTRDYGARSGYVVRYTNRSYWWDGERRTPIIER